MNGHRNQFHLVASILAAFLLAWGCSSSSPYPQMDAEEVFAEAEALYEAEEWSDAVEALEHFTGRFPIHEKQADARWMLANAYFERGDYIQAATEFDGFAVITSHDRWFLDRVATHILAFEGDSQVTWFPGGYSEYEEDYKQRKGEDALQPHRIKYKPLTRRAS